MKLVLKITSIMAIIVGSFLLIFWLPMKMAEARFQREVIAPRAAIEQAKENVAKAALVVFIMEYDEAIIKQKPLKDEGLDDAIVKYYVATEHHYRDDVTTANPDSPTRPNSDALMAYHDAKAQLGWPFQKKQINCGSPNPLPANEEKLCMTYFRASDTLLTELKKK